MKVALYARVSTKDQQTIPAQPAVMRTECKLRGWQVALEIKEKLSGMLYVQLAGNGLHCDVEKLVSIEGEKKEALEKASVNCELKMVERGTEPASAIRAR